MISCMNNTPVHGPEIVSQHPRKSNSSKRKCLARATWEHLTKTRAAVLFPCILPSDCWQMPLCSRLLNYKGNCMKPNKQFLVICGLVSIDITRLLWLIPQQCLWNVTCRNSLSLLYSSRQALKSLNYCRQTMTEILPNKPLMWEK